MNKVLEKLKVKKEDIVILNMPDFVKEFEDIKYRNRCSSKEDIVFVFVKDREELKNKVLELINKDILNIDGNLFVAYPKKGNTKIETFIHRDEIFEIFEVNTSGYVKDSFYKFNKMISLNEIYTIIGLKRTEKMEESKTSSIDEYINYIPLIREFLKDTDVSSFFEEIPYGYKKQWAYYVYSAKKDETINKRKEEMYKLLKEGIKIKK